MRVVEKTEGADPVRVPEDAQSSAATRRGEGHGLGPLVPAVPVAEGDGAIVAGDDGAVGERGLVDVGGRGTRGPSPARTTGLAKTIMAYPRGMGGNATPGGASAAPGGEAPAEALAGPSQGTIGVRRRGAGIHVRPSGARARQDQHVDVRVPLRVRVRVWSTARAPIRPPRKWGSAHRSSSEVKAARKDRQERRLVGAHEPPQLGGEREDDVEVGDRQEQLLLTCRPAQKVACVSAPRTGTVVARVVEQVLGVAPRAHARWPPISGVRQPEMDTGVHVAGQHGARGAPCRPDVPPDDVGEPEHGSGSRYKPTMMRSKRIS